jgi:hypothetical protein
MSFQISERAAFWLRVVIGVIAIVVVIQLIRVNQPGRPSGTERPGAASTTSAVYTFGTVVKGPLQIRAGEYKSFTINTNKRSTLKGEYHTGSIKRTVGVFLVRDEDVERWLKGEDVPPVVATGYVPGGGIDRTIDAGKYKLIFDNRKSEEDLQELRADFVVN